VSVVSPDLPAAFAQSAAFGDFVAAMLALLRPQHQTAMRLTPQPA
jgi:hypothetical protein